MGADTARVQNVAFLQDRAAEGDVVRFQTDAEGRHRAVGRVSASGNCTTSPRADLTAQPEASAWPHSARRAVPAPAPRRHGRQRRHGARSLAGRARGMRRSWREGRGSVTGARQGGFDRGLRTLPTWCMSANCGVCEASSFARHAGQEIHPTHPLSIGVVPERCPALRAAATRSYSPGGKHVPPHAQDGGGRHHRTRSPPAVCRLFRRLLGRRPRTGRPGPRRRHREVGPVAEGPNAASLSG
ncbi:DUF4265 domain-containing protein [Kitasatospora sp. NPDC088346]|uniref:DUF4265 domain-containing protein n=1 Tax=Kitasatospora sp. NPDC088346 TaxID=3364073 RepID=UPI00381C838D